MANSAPANYLDNRCKIEIAWGVPVGIVRLSELVAARPANHDPQTVWQRTFDDLSRSEKKAIYDAIARMHQGQKTLSRNFNTQTKNIHQTASRFWATIQSDIIWNKLSSFAITHPILKNGTHASDLGPNDYKEREKALICLNDTLPLEEEISRHFLGEEINDNALKNIDRHAWHALILEHELAHIAGADEAQADLIAAAMVMKELGRDSEVRLLADLRAISSVANHVQAELYKKMKDLGLDDILYNMQMCNDASFDKAVTFHQRYGWKQMQALDHAINKGIRSAKSMTYHEIHNLRFRDITPETGIQRGFARALLEICIEKGFYTPTPGLLVMAAINFEKKQQAQTIETQEKNDLSVTRMLHRFTGAATRLIKKPKPHRPPPMIRPAI